MFHKVSSQTPITVSPQLIDTHLDKLLAFVVTSPIYRRSPDLGDSNVCINGLLSQIALTIPPDTRGITRGIIVSPSYMLLGENLIHNYWFGFRHHRLLDRFDIDEQLLFNNLLKTKPEMLGRMTNQHWMQIVHLHIWKNGLLKYLDNLSTVINKVVTKSTFSAKDLNRLQYVRNVLSDLYDYNESYIENLNKDTYDSYVTQLH